MSLFYAAILIPVILGVQRFAGERISPTAKHALWFLFLIRLSLLELPESPLSVFNLVPPAERKIAQPDLTIESSPLPITKLVSSDFTAVPPTDHPVIIANDLPLISVQGPLMGPALFEPSVAGTPSSTPGKRPLNAVDLPKNLSSPDSPQATPINWQQALLILWAGGVLLFTAQVVISWSLFRHRFRFKSQSFPPNIESLIETCHEAVGLKQRVPVFETDLVSSPVLCGLLSPRILLPIDFTQSYSEAQLAHVITHELAHHKRKDALWNIWSTLVQIFHWPNPLVWFAHSRMRADRELATDFLALKALRRDQSMAYGETILKSLQSASRQQTIPGLIGISENRNNLLRRFRMISDFQKHRKYSFVALTIVLISMTVTILTDAESQPTPKQPLATPLESNSKAEAQRERLPRIRGPLVHSIDVTVLDRETKAPIPGVSISYSLNWDRKPQETVRTDDSGIGRLNIYRPKREQPALTLRAQPTTTYTGQARSWQIPSQRWTELPTTYTFYHSPGQQIGGIIVNSKNSPVRGAKLSIFQHRRAPNEFINTVNFDIPFDRGVETDDEGRWFVDGAPKNLENLMLTVQESSGAQHEFTSAGELYIPLLDFAGKRIQTSDLKSGNSEIKLPSGRDVRVKVTNEAGRAIPQAKITEVHGTIDKRVGFSLTTDQTGNARFTGRPDREITYVARHPDYAIGSNVAFLNQAKQDLDIVIPSLHPLRARVVDKTGTPIRDALVNLATPSNEEFYIDWETTTDDKGYFEWKQAPRFDFHLQVEAPLFEAAVFSSEQLRGSETLTLQKPKESPLRLRVTIVDEDKGLPIERFHYALIRELTNGFEIHGSGQGGKLEIDTSRTRFTSSILPRVQSAYYVAIRSPGYREAYSRRIALNETTPTIEIQLKKSQPSLNLTGRKIFTPEGEPAIRAQLIMISSPGFVPYLMQQQGKFEMHSRNQAIQVHTDSDGILPPVPLPEQFRGVFIYHKRGTLALSEQELARTTGPLTLQARGGLQGKLSIEGKTFENRKIRLTTEKYPHNLFTCYFSSESDNEGQFNFDSVPAGTYQLYLTPPNFRSGVMTPSYQKPITIQPGEKKYVDYAHRGVRVRGRLTAERIGNIADWRHGQFHLTSVNTESIFTDRPSRHHYVNWKRFTQANETFVNQAQSKARDKLRSYYLNIEPGGFFTVEAVPPGDYHFKITVTEPKQGGVGPGWMREKVIGRLTQGVTVPAGPDHFVFDAGTLRVLIEDQESLPVPELPSIQSVNQQGELSSKRIQGKTAILHFWAAWAEDGSEWWPALERLRASDQDENALTVLSFNVDSMKHEMEGFLKGTTHTWPIGYLPPDKASQALRHFGIQTLPATLVVDPSGAVSLNPGDVETLEEMIAAAQKM